MNWIALKDQRPHVHQRCLVWQPEIGELTENPADSASIASFDGTPDGCSFPESEYEITHWMPINGPMTQAGDHQVIWKAPDWTPHGPEDDNDNI